MLPLVLASSSQYRKTLLQRLEIPFAVVSPEVDESPLANEAPAALVQRLAESKARAAAAAHPQALIIASDQIALADDEVLGKPGGYDQAVRQLERLSGRRATFMTALCLLNSGTGHLQMDVVPYTVEFRELARGEIERYVAREKPFDCSGAFKSEGLGIALVARFAGDDPAALIGLPLIRLIDMLGKENVTVL